MLTMVSKILPSHTGRLPVRPQALVLVPTRELGVQILREAKLYSQGTNLRIQTIYGGTDPMAQQKMLKVSY